MFAIREYPNIIHSLSLPTLQTFLIAVLQYLCNVRLVGVTYSSWLVNEVS